MARLTKLIVTLLILTVIGAAVFLATGEFPPPSKSVEQVIDNKRFQR
tara:strand:+ start:170 stop:310 length:141 start_codon:yes stop_codon:yes gene_type:complete